MLNSVDKKIASVTAAVAIVSGAMLAGGITGFHETEALREELNAETDLQKENAKQHRNFWKAMTITANVMAAAAGMAGGYLIKDAFGLGKKK